MVAIKEIKNQYYLIEGDNIDELVSFCLRRIRSISQDFYKKELRKDLETMGYSWIDYHAGIKNNYDVKLIET